METEKGVLFIIAILGREINNGTWKHQVHIQGTTMFLSLDICLERSF